MSEAHAGHLATRRHAALFDFSFMGLYQFGTTGALQPLQSRNLERIRPGRIAYTLLLDDDGRVVNDATVWNLGGGEWWLFSGRRADAAWIGGRAAPRVRTGEHAVIALQGPASGAILARLAGEPLVRSLGYFDFAALPGSLGPGRVGRIGYSGELGYEIVVPAGDAPALRTRLREAAGGELVDCGFEVADTLRIEAGYLLFDREITGRERPAELGLERLVESRRARVAPSEQRLVGLRIQPGIHARRPWLAPARATSECLSPLFGAIGIGFVAAGDAAPGAPVQLQDGRLARLARLPFYDPARRRPRLTPL